MADWKQLAKALALADNTVEDREVDILRDAFFADGRIDDEELEFLFELKRGAYQLTGTLDQLILDCQKARGE